MAYDLGLLGMGVMGQNLALNFHNNGYSVTVYNRTTEKTQNFVSKHPEIKGSTTLREFVDNLTRPRRVLLMVTAGPAVDATLNDLDKYLEKGDVVIDGGNSFFQDTERRCTRLSERGIHYMGVGVSGGEEGALKGPCIMAGGSREGYDQVSKMLMAVAAKAEGACCQLLGPRGAGHYVKMVHNGIEYAVMQIMAEAYDLLTRYAAFDTKQVHDVFAEWNKAELNSFLMEIATQVLERVDPETKKPLVSLILDSAKQKGTGKWTSQNAMDLGIPTPTIDAAVGARNLSALKPERVAASKLTTPKNRERSGGIGPNFVEQLRSAVQASIIISYAQGFHLMRAASNEYGYGLPFVEIARIWKGGCIIRAKLLDSIKQAYMKNGDLLNLVVDPQTASTLSRLDGNWRELVGIAKEHGIPIPAINASLDYYDGYKSERLPANFIQALRDHFGAHGYERIDKQGRFHTDWTT
ncbi:MAG TPA: NADP-dependent phosphogluconate dehydrogenase [Candidatus Bathyarchaeia archaeon]|nr:NADP-dependent phosphogluconate dehydrogenase [Candidatus Bathyarchaeia archaeon]